MDIRSRGKRLATGVTAAVSLGSLAVVGIESAAVYAGTPHGTTTVTTNNSGTSGQGDDQGNGGTTGNNGDNGSSLYNGYTGVTPVQPGNGGSIHSRSSGS